MDRFVYLLKIFITTTKIIFFSTKDEKFKKSPRQSKRPFTKKNFFIPIISMQCCTLLLSTRWRHLTIELLLCFTHNQYKSCIQHINYKKKTSQIRPLKEALKSVRGLNLFKFPEWNQKRWWSLPSLDLLKSFRLYLTLIIKIRRTLWFKYKRAKEAFTHVTGVT